MRDLPALPPNEAVRALERAGFVRTRQRGSHLFLVHPDGRRTTISIHRGDMKRGTLNVVINQAV